jgi:hypothetical protein
MSGLTLGLFSLPRMELQLLLESGTPRQRRNAARILPVRCAHSRYVPLAFLLCARAR